MGDDNMMPGDNSGWYRSQEEPEIVECPNCGGSGYEDEETKELCERCKGEGEIVKDPYDYDDYDPRDDDSRYEAADAEAATGSEATDG